MWRLSEPWSQVLPTGHVLNPHAILRLGTCDYALLPLRFITSAQNAHLNPKPQILTINR